MEFFETFLLHYLKLEFNFNLILEQFNDSGINYIQVKSI